MMKFQSEPSYFYSVVIAICVIFSMLSATVGFKGYETGFLAGFLFLINIPFLFQMNKLTIPYNFIHNKTLHT
ncbi:MAG TPA: hypothetical protein VLM44_10690, partial [Lutibacter sp.]|nr:hypothetical protein [Lutibacter sp.]